MFPDKSALQLVRAYDVTGDEIIATLIAPLSCVACQRSRLLKWQFMRIEEAVRLIRDALAPAWCSCDT